MAGLSTFQSGPKGSKRDQNGQPRCFWPFGSPLGPSGPPWTISDKNDFFAPNGQSMVLRRCSKAKNQFLFKTVQKGLDGPKRVGNDQIHLGWPFVPAPFGLFYFSAKLCIPSCFWLMQNILEDVYIHPSEQSYNVVNVIHHPHPCHLASPSPSKYLSLW